MDDLGSGGMQGEPVAAAGVGAAPAETIDAETARLLAMVDPEFRAAAMMMRQGMNRFAPMSMDKLKERRAWIASLPAEPLPDVPFEERRVPVPGGGEVRVYVVNARPGEARPGVLHIHGGGFNASSARGSLRNVQELAVGLDCPVVTVDYTIAPEAIWSQSLEENYAALLWMRDHGAEIGIDAERIALTGDSAGGGHAALLSVAARDRGEARIAFQALIYPMLDDRTGSSRAVPEHIGAFGWNVDANRFGWECFLGQRAGMATVPPGSVPARVEDLSGLPPTFIGVGALDLFVDESIDYARRLIDAGVPTELAVVPGAFHGFDMIVKDAAASRAFTAAKLAAIRRGWEG